MTKKFFFVFLTVLFAVFFAVPSTALALSSTRMIEVSSVIHSTAETGRLQRYYGGRWTSYAYQTIKLYVYDSNKKSWTYKGYTKTSGTGYFTVKSLNHNNRWKLVFSGNSKYNSTTKTFETKENLPVRPNPFSSPATTLNTETVTYRWSTTSAPHSYRVTINGITYLTLPGNSTSFSISSLTAGPLLVQGDNVVGIVAENCSGGTIGRPIILRYGSEVTPLSAEAAFTQAWLLHLKDTYKYTDNVTVQFGSTPNDYQAVCYYSSGRIVISSKHTVNIWTILDHEIWHAIDFNDNGRIDWGERIAPKNAADYLR